MKIKHDNTIATPVVHDPLPVNAAPVIQHTIEAELPAGDGFNLAFTCCGARRPESGESFHTVAIDHIKGSSCQQIFIG